MPKFYVQVSCYYGLIVEAEDVEQAEQKAFDVDLNTAPKADLTYEVIEEIKE